MGENLARAEAQHYAELEKSIEAWWNTPRFKYTKRPYTAKQVASLRGTLLLYYTSALIYFILITFLLFKCFLIHLQVVVGVEVRVLILTCANASSRY